MTSLEKSAINAYLEKYADTLLKIGLNVQAGQTIVIEGQLEMAPLVRVLAKRAYAAGAAEVLTDLADDELTRIRLQHMPEQSIGRYPQWKADGYYKLAEEGAGFLIMQAPNPDLLRDVDPQRVGADQKGRATIRRPFLQMLRENKASWTIAGAATPVWAAKVFPQLQADEALHKLWASIWQATRADLDDPVAAWQRHLSGLRERLAKLNGKRYRTLRYRSAGTDLTVELPERHLWVAGSAKNARGIDFVPNMPTEEVFTSPRRGGVNGVVRSTMPLNYGGRLIEGIELHFKDGLITSGSAAAGNETLQQLLAIDEGARRLGEIALVPHDSPISNMGVVFYNTVFDENAACHMAVGNGFTFCLEGGDQMEEAERDASGLNRSLTHVDFMMGSADLDIDGILPDGSIEPLFRKGNWAD